jgi:DNA-binding NtrC family response regulator/tetratricopeptide (TPR) repeat protein
VNEVERGGAPAAAPAGAGSAESAFSSLCRWLRAGVSSATDGVDERASALVVSSASTTGLLALADHVQRSLESAARAVVRGNGGDCAEGFLDALRVVVDGADGPLSSASASSPSLRPAEVATALARSGAAIVVVDPRASAFARSVFVELHKQAARVTWVVGSRPPLDADIAAKIASFEVDGQLESTDVAKWWAVASSGVAPVEPTSLAELELRLRVATHGLRAGFGARAGSALRARLDLVGRAVPPGLLLTLAAGLPGEPDALLAELDADPTIDRHGGWYLARSTRAPSTPASSPDAVEEATPDALSAVVTVLELLAAGRTTAVASTSSSACRDPWALVRGAEVALTFDVARADSLATRALMAAPDAATRAEFWDVLVPARLSRRAPEDAATLASWSDLALALGDADVALQLAKGLTGRCPAPEHTLLLGRALSATGDLVGAAGLLARVVDDGAAPPEARARASVELAEARYFSNDFEGAASSAARVAALLSGSAPTAAHRALALDARNVEGKLLLARGEFAAAEAHFVEDACDAAILGLRAPELRARANRAISVMAMNRRGEAQTMLEDILRDAEQHGELRATGIALTNLVPLAIFDHRYMDALSLSERSVELLRRIGDRIKLARVVLNLAEVRLMLGLVDEAAHAVRFAPVFLGAPSERVWRSAVLCRISLARGDSASAQRHVLDALAAVGAGDLLKRDGATLPNGIGGLVNDRVCDALLVGARAALEDGDVQRAELFLSRAETDKAPPRLAGFARVLSACVARAKGEDFTSLAQDALQHARDLDDDELLLESHWLLHLAANQAGQRSSARHHLQSACAMRDRVASTLSPALRASYLGRRDLADLNRAISEDSGTSWDGAGDARPSVSSTPSSGTSSATFVGNHPSMKALAHAIRKVGPSDSTVLIHGESGTGKELVAEALHRASPRAKGPLVKVNCAALVETLLLSELFGYEKGAFTGAASRRRGRFEAAEGGTLFLDEIGDISARTQVALLRVLQEKTFERVGGNTSVRADVRIVCATHRDLKALVEAGLFREDLYYRLCGIVLQVPALRKRRSDIAPISTALLARIAEERGGAVKNLSQRALHALGTHTWPGNVRELENALRAASLFAEGHEIEIEDFSENVESLRHLSESSIDVLPPISVAPVTSPSVGERVPSSTGAALAQPPSVISAPSASSPSDVAYAAVRSGVSLHDMKRSIERDCIARALTETSGNITRAAAVLGMKRPRLSQLVKQYELGASGDEGANDTDGGEFDAAAEEE